MIMDLFKILKDFFSKLLTITKKPEMTEQIFFPMSSTRTSSTTKLIETTISISTYNHLIDWEGKSNTAYDDGAGYMTIGIGHAIFDKNEKFEGKTLLNSKLTEEQIYRLLEQDLKKRIKAEEQIKNKIKHPLTQNQYDALVLFCFNTGTLWNDLSAKINSYLTNTETYSQVLKNQFRKYRTVKGVVMAGLINRREGELDLFFDQYKGRNFYQKPTGSYTLNGKIINPYY